MLGRTQYKTIAAERGAVCGTTSLRCFCAAAVALAARSACFAVAPRIASAGTPYVDEVSDQSEASWSSNFAQSFNEHG